MSLQSLKIEELEENSIHMAYPKVMVKFFVKAMDLISYHIIILW